MIADFLKLFSIFEIIFPMTNDFRCPILNIHNFGRNRHFLILKANESSYSPVLFSLLKMIFKTF